MHSRILTVTAVVLAIAVVTGSGAFTTLSVDRSATIDASGDASGWLGIEPHSGPNGGYAFVRDGKVHLDVADADPGSDPDGTFLGGDGVNVDATGTADRVFNVTNHGTQSVRVWIEDGTDAVSFSTVTDDHGSVDGEANAFELVPGRTMEVGFAVDTSGVAAGDRVLESITLNAAATGATVPDGGDSPPAEEPSPLLLIGAPGELLTTIDDRPGAVYGLTSTPTGTVSLPTGSDFVLVGEESGDRAGRSVAVAGDVNGDGVDDLLVSAYRNDASGNNAGATYLIYGPVSGTINLATADVTFTGESSADRAGESVAGVGDVNGDGFDDVLVGADRNDPGGNSAGAAYLVYGSATLSGTRSLATADATFTGEGLGDFAGDAVAGAGDVNGDGFEDFLISAFGNDTASTDAGAAYLVYGSATLSGTRSLTTADAKFTGEGLGDRAGDAVAGAGDVNGDGFDDLLVGAKRNDAGGSSAGAAYLVYGSATLSGTRSLATADAKFTGESSTDRAGGSVAGAGDVNDDGFDDLLVGADGNDAGGNGAGAAYLVYGSPTLGGTRSLATADAKFTGESQSDFAGEAVAGVGDVNGDGFDDVLVGAPFNDAGGNNAGAAYLIHGAVGLDGTISLSEADVVLLGDTDDYAGTSVAGGGT